jgi:hypothetical protein
MWIGLNHLNATAKLVPLEKKNTFHHTQTEM